MEQYIDIEEYMLTQKDTFVKRRKAPVSGIATLAGGTAITLLSLHLHCGEDLQMALLSFGVMAGLAGFGIILFGCLIGQYIYLPTGSRMRSRKAFVSKADRGQLESLLKSGDLAQIDDVRKTNSSSCLLQAYVSDDKSIALVQMKDYVANNFATATPPMTFEGEQARVLERFLI